MSAGWVRQTQRLIEDLSDLVRSSRGDIQLRLQPLDLREQVMINLLRNAARYTPSGGRISLSVAAEGGEFIVRLPSGAPSHSGPLHG